MEIELPCRREPSRHGRSRSKILHVFLPFFSALPGSLLYDLYRQKKRREPNIGSKCSHLGTPGRCTFLIVWLFFCTLDPLGVQMEARTAKITKTAPQLPPKLSLGHSKLGQHKNHRLVIPKKTAKECDSGPLFFTLPKQ